MKIDIVIAVVLAGLITTDLAKCFRFVLQAAADTTLQDKIVPQQRTCTCRIENIDPTLAKELLVAKKGQ